MRCLYFVLVNGSSAFALALEDECHSLTLDGLSNVASRLAPFSFAGRLLCLHALSSFQRTGSPTSHASLRHLVENPTDRPFLTVFRGTF